MLSKGVFNSIWQSLFVYSWTLVAAWDINLKKGQDSVLIYIYIYFLIEEGMDTGKIKNIVSSYF